MKIYKLFGLFVTTLLSITFLTACGGGGQEEEIAVKVALTQTAAAIVEAESAHAVDEPVAAKGTITGFAHLQGPPTPALVIYAVDETTGAWFSIETPETNEVATYVLDVAPGTYRLFAFPAGLGYSEGGWSLTPLTIGSGQTIRDIYVRPPSQSLCGSTFGVPASPDGRFAEIPGPTEVCKQAVLAGMTAGDYQILEFGECSDIAIAVSDKLGRPGVSTDAPYIDYINNLIGFGCLMTIEGTGQDFGTLEDINTIVSATLNNFGYLEDSILSPAGGPGAIGNGYRQGNKQCQLLAYWEPSAEVDCPADQPIDACDITPDQQIYTITLNCAQGPIDSVALPKTEPTRIEFEPGAISAQIEDSLAASGLGQYMLYAMAGQEMTINLYASGDAVLVIWGLDGTVLISDHAGTTSWEGELPYTQDYFIDVRSYDAEPVNYILEVIIPPPADTSAGQVYPMVEPFDSNNMQIIVQTGVPPMLPAKFPIEPGLPTIFPFLLTTDQGEYEFSLDYGVECRGAGACHYGVIAGKGATGNMPTGTRSFPFEADRAEQFSLAYGISGWFVDYTCGANCNDAKVYWIYDGNEYMIGVKAGPRQNVIDLANATIANSIP